MRVLILGGNGFIGSEICRTLASRGHQVTALAREPGAAAQRRPEIAWLRHDLRRMQAAADWAFLTDFDAVVNCAGALQDGARDDVATVQHGAMLAMYDAAKSAGIGLVVQISARTDGAGSESDFLASKRHADAALAASGLPFVIIRPAIVVGRNAHGGAALLRALAAIPWRTPLVHAGAPMQFTAVAEVADTACEAIEGRVAPGSDIALAGTQPLTLGKAVALYRAWLGLPPARTIEVSSLLAAPIVFVADLLGHLGWRSPLRSTTMEIASGGAVAATASAASRSSGASLADILAANPAGAQDLWFARLYLLKPIVFGALSLFWLASGVIALAHFEQSSSILAHALGVDGLAQAVTILTSLADILLGAGVLVRRYARPVLFGTVLVSVAYLAAATILTPALWADPLGPLVKAVPSIVLALVALAILDER